MTKPKPSCHALFDRKTRKTLELYLALGYVGFVIGEALAYIEILEDELARREAEEGA